MKIFERMFSYIVFYDLLRLAVGVAQLDHLRSLMSEDDDGRIGDGEGQSWGHETCMCIRVASNHHVAII